jgi:hypothetical protein
MALASLAELEFCLRMSSPSEEHSVSGALTMRDVIGELWSRFRDHRPTLGHMRDADRAKH